MHKSKISILLSSLLALSLTACGSGSSGDNGGGGDNSVTIKTLSTLSGINTTYSPTCMYHSMQNQSWYLVKSDGSGSGVQYFESTGTVTTVSSGLPILNVNSICQPNKYQLTWVDNGNATVLNAYDGYGHTSSFNLASAGLSGTQVSSTSFAFNYDGNYLVANSNFSNNNFGLSKLVGSSPVSYSALPVSLLNNRSNSVLYGFQSITTTGGSDTLIEQLLPANTANNIPATYAQYNVSAESVLVSINFVDSNGSPISAMNGTVDVIPSSTMSLDYVIQTGLVQPSLYVCKVTGGVGNVGTATCGNPLTSSSLASQYKIMRLLSYNGTTIVFYGLNLTNQTIGIFSIVKN